MMKMKRGELWWVKFHPTEGEMLKTRPAVIVSSDNSNEFIDRVQIVPFTSKITRVYPSEVLLVVDGRMAKAMANQLQTVNKSRILKKIGMLTDEEMHAVEKTIRIQLDL